MPLYRTYSEGEFLLGIWKSDETTDEEKKKAARKKIRNYTYSMRSTIVENKSEKLISAFLDFYKSAYVLNDFSFASIASENRPYFRGNT